MKKNIFLTLALVAGMLLSLAPFTPAGAIQPRSGHVPPAPASLNEVVEYYGRLGDIQGQIGVVVEFSSKPAAVVYAEAKERLLAPAALAAITKSQVSLIQEEQNTFASALGSSGIDARELYRTQRAYNGIALYVDADKVAELAKLPGIKAIHPLIPKEIDHTTSVPLIGALQVWAGSSAYQGQNIRVGIIDTGIDYIHTNFGGLGNYTGQDFTTLGEPGNLFPTAKVVGGWDFAGDNYDAGGSGPALIPQPDPDPMDCNGHGSHVAGTAAGFGVLPTGATYVEGVGDTYADLAALSVNNYMAKFRIGPGVAPKADLYALRVFGCAGSTNLTDLAIDWAMDPNGDNDLSDHLDVINMSLGSNFGSQYDSSSVASNNAALAGVLVVASAGNSGDVFYVTGAPSVAQRAISVASSQDSSAVLSAFDVTASTNALLVGSYMAGTASFGPQSFNVTGDAVVAAPYQACTAITNVVSGKIAVIQRGTCTFALKVENAQAAGAIGVLIVNNAAGFPPALGGTSTATIPVMSARDVDGNAIVAELNASGTATIKLDSSLNYLIVDPTLEDKVSTFTSRGVARGGSYLKPDITAPGDTIYSTANGTGDKGVSFNGTSMAAPHVTGVMALLRQQHPTWSVEDLKALVMNTATSDVYNAAGTLPNTPSRVGAGRVSVLNATQSAVVAYNATNPEMVSLPFGEVKVVENASGVDQTFTKSVTVKNTGAAAETYNVAFVSRYAANPGITFSLLDSADNPLSSLTVPAGGTETIKVKVDLDAALLQKTLDPTLSLAGGRSHMSESGGLVQLTSTGSAPTLRVPVHIAARAASSMDVVETSLTLPAASGTVSLTPSGTPVDLASDFSIAAILELLGESPALPGLPVPTLASADLQYIGAMSNYPAVAWADSTVFFGVSTFAQWDTLYSTEFDIYIDINEDGVDDYVVYNYDTGAGTTTRTDAFATVVFNLSTSSGALSNYVNYFGGSTNTNLFNNNVAVLPVDVAQIGLNETTNTDFNFYIVTYHRESETYVDVSDVYHYDAGKKAFDSTNAAILNTPFWDDNPAYAPTFNIAYNKAYMSAATKGLLFLHHHNAVNTAEVVPFNHGNAIPDPWVGGVAIYADQPVVAVGRPHLGSQVASYAGASAGGTTQYVPMLFKDAFGGSYDSALYVQNLGNASANLSVAFTSETGTVVHTVADTLPANASKGYWLPGISGLGASFVGSAKITSDQPVLAVGRPHIGAEVMTYNGFTAGATTAYLPMFFKNGFSTYNSALYIQNVTANPAVLSIQYLNTNGTVACTKADTLGANASKGYWSLQVTCDTGSLPSGFVGGVKVTSDQAIVAVGRAHLGAQITTYNGSDTGMTDAYVPMLFRRAFAGGSYNAALYLQNVSGSSANVTIEYRDNAGTVAATQNVILAPSAISSIWLPAVAGLPDGFVGGAFISSDQPVIAVGRPHLGSEITAYNGAPAMAGVAYLPMLFRNAFGVPYNAAYYIQNTSASPAKASIFFYNDAGSLLCVKGISLAANATVGFWSPATACLP